ncbi:uncharacterized protein LOC109788474 [Cajanus cajan]|uniref:uncharacterized protein LOC109788474 n=1 Tax=Cajanus cajan TaxID=3821 RepID=UPI00098D7F74|nr:uncharacterized protein LOC109788474 [Cajanus cajan]
MEFHSNSWKLEELQLNNNSMQDLHVSAIGRTEPTMKEEVERSQLGVKHEVANTVLQVENMMLEAKGRDSELDQRVRELIDELQDLVSFKKEYGSTVVTSINRRDSEIELVGPSLQRATHQYDYEHIVDIEKIYSIKLNKSLYGLKQSSRMCKEQFVHMMRLDAVFIMELILRDPNMCISVSDG